MQPKLRTDATQLDFTSLVAQLDKELAEIDGEENAFYAQYNGLEQIKHAVVIYGANEPVACGAIKEFDSETMEVKRMYTSEESRGQGLASEVLAELESWAKELGYKCCVLETGLRQAAVISLYKKNNYHLIPNYGQYIGVENSRCFRKSL